MKTRRRGVGVLAVGMALRHRPRSRLRCGDRAHIRHRRCRRYRPGQPDPGGDDPHRRRVHHTTVAENGASPFAVAVTDLLYDRVGYQVSATLSDLYPWDPVNEYGDCTGTPVASGDLGIAFPTNPTKVTDVEGLLETVSDWSGELDAVTLAELVAIGLDTNLLTNGNVLEVADVESGRQQLASDDFLTGLEDALPIKVLAGDGGSFTSPDDHPVCTNGTLDGTVLTIMSGSRQDLTALGTWLHEKLDGLFDAADSTIDGALTATEAVAGGLVEQAALEGAIQDALEAAGSNLLQVGDQVRRVFQPSLSPGTTITDRVLLGNKTDLGRRFRVYPADVTTDPDTGAYSIADYRARATGRCLDRCARGGGHARRESGEGHGVRHVPAGRG